MLLFIKYLKLPGMVQRAMQQNTTPEKGISLIYISTRLCFGAHLTALANSLLLSPKPHHTANCCQGPNMACHITQNLIMWRKMNSSSKQAKLDIRSTDYRNLFRISMVPTCFCCKEGNRKHKGLALPALPRLLHISIFSEVERLISGQRLLLPLPSTSLFRPSLAVKLFSF